MSGPDRSVLRTLPPFAGLAYGDLDTIVAKASSRLYPPGSPVFEQGAEAVQFCVLLRGRLRVTQVTPTGDQIVVRMVHPGELCGIARPMGRDTY